MTNENKPLSEKRIFDIEPWTEKEVYKYKEEDVKEAVEKLKKELYEKRYVLRHALTTTQINIKIDEIFGEFT